MEKQKRRSNLKEHRDRHTNRQTDRQSERQKLVDSQARRGVNRQTEDYSVCMLEYRDMILMTLTAAFHSFMRCFNCATQSACRCIVESSIADIRHDISAEERHTDKHTQIHTHRYRQTYQSQIKTHRHTLRDTDRQIRCQVYISHQSLLIQ